MGLIKAAMGAASGVMGDQWKEYFYCDALPAEVLAVKGQKRTNGRSANRHGSENVISDGSVIAVADGQCVLIVEQGKVVDLCAEPGEYTYSTGTQPSLLSGGLKNIDSVFAELGKRFSFGGQAGSDQRIYYINTRELTGNKYGTPNPVPFRVVDQRAGIDIDIGIRCFGRGVEQYHALSIALLDLQRGFTRDNFITTAVTNDGQRAAAELVAHQGVDRQTLDLLVVDEVVVILGGQLGQT